MPADRRWFLRAALVASGLTAGGSLARAAVVPRGGKAKQVLVLGAGLAGLTAAYELMLAGHEVTVIEARKRPGGRVHTLRTDFTDGLYAEGGAIDFSDNYALLTQYISSFNLESVSLPVFPKRVVYFRGTRYVTPPDPLSALRLTAEERTLGLSGVFKQFVTSGSAQLGDPYHPTLDSLFARKLDQTTVNGLLRSQGVSADAIDWFSTLVYGPDFDHVSALESMLTEHFSSTRQDTKALKGGNDTLPRAFAAKLGSRIRYQEVVIRIGQSDDRASVTVQHHGSQHMLTADHVIVTLPFSVLRTVYLDSTFPAEKRAAIAQLQYDSCMRVYLQTRTRLWAEQGISGDARSDLPIGTVVDHTSMQAGTRGILEAQMVHEKAELARRLDPDVRLRQAVQLMDKVHPGVASEYECGSSFSWDDDPYSRGSWSMYSPGQILTLLPHAAAAAGRVHFAGEHTSWLMGSMEGAIQSGQRAAAEIA